VAITNAFTGRQGQEIARAFASRGITALVISGPTDLPDVAHPLVNTVHVTSMKDMQRAVRHAMETPPDYFVGVAAVADFSMQDQLDVKLAPGAVLALQLRENPSIVAGVATQVPRPHIVVSFAAQAPETLDTYAREKFGKAGVDLTVANPIGPGTDPLKNRVTLLYRQNGQIMAENLDEMSKNETAERIVEKILSLPFAAL
jgi:phosphopantothenoylcysteine decarboxylase / phosphopantothenate---cysteine ligase